MREWWSLYKKEVSALSFFMLVAVLIVTGWQLFLGYKLGTWPMEMVFGLSFLPLSFYHLLMLWQGYQSFRREWKGNTIYFLLSLPRAGWQILLAKLAAGMTFFTGITLFTLLSIYVTNRDVIKVLLTEITSEVDINTIMGITLWLILVYLVAGLIIYVMSQFSYLVSRFYNRFRGLISIVVFLLEGYILYRGGSLLAPVFSWLPDIPIRIMGSFGEMVGDKTIYVGSGPLVGTLVMLVTVFLCGSLLLERYLDV